MPRSPDGTYTQPNPDVQPGEVVSSTWANTTVADIAQALTESLSREGNGSMSAPLPFADGAENAPGIAWGAEPITGFYRAATGDMRVTVIGVDTFRWIQTGPEVWTGSAWAKVLYEGLGGTVPDGTDIGQSLAWSGSAWVAQFTASVNVSYDPTGNLVLTATDVQTVLGEVDAGLYSYINHAGDTSVHYADVPADGQVYNRQDGNWVPAVTGVTDHGLLQGLADDDHTQYFNEARGDARYTLSTDFSAHTGDTDVHFSDAPADGQSYARQNNAWTLSGAGGGTTPMVGEMRLFYGNLANLQPGWYFCDGTNGTPDLRGRTVFGEGGAYTEGASGGTTAVTRNVVSSGSHSHFASSGSTSHTHGRGGLLRRAAFDQAPNGFEFYAGTLNEVQPESNHTHGISVLSSGSHVHSLVDADPPHFVVTGYILYTGVI